MSFIKIEQSDTERIKELSKLATHIVKEHFDPLIGAEQNDYMISKFQTVEAITEQLECGYQYYFFLEKEEIIGFLAFYKKGTEMYLSKFYLIKEFRGRNLSKMMLEFVIEQTKAENLKTIVLNVNRNNSAVKAYEKMGFCKIREEKNDIGHDFFMDDYVMAYRI